MPCFDPPPTRADYEESFRHNSKLAEMFCSVMRILADDGDLDYVLKVAGKDVQQWWDEHVERDHAKEERARRELEEIKTKKQALAKLTDAERKALGL